MTTMHIGCKIRTCEQFAEEGTQGWEGAKYFELPMGRDVQQILVKWELRCPCVKVLLFVVWAQRDEGGSQRLQWLGWHMGTVWVSKVQPVQYLYGYGYKPTPLTHRFWATPRVPINPYRYVPIFPFRHDLSCFFLSVLFFYDILYYSVPIIQL